MSSNFTGVTFAEQRVTPVDDAQIRRAILPDGILSGCELSYSGSTLTMTAGSLIACGRQFRHPAAQNWAVVDATSGYARLLLTIDLTRTSTADAFEQVVDTIEYASAVDGFPALVQTDINGAGTKYQVVACVVSLGAGGITGIISEMDAANVLAAVTAAKLFAPAGEYTSIDKLWENASPTSSFAAQTISVSVAGYDFFIVRSQNSAGTNNHAAIVFPDVAHRLPMVTTTVSYREITFNSAGNTVTFGDAMNYDDFGATSGSKANTRCIPYEIFGVKGVS